MVSFRFFLQVNGAYTKVVLSHRIYFIALNVLSKFLNCVAASIHIG